MPGLCVLIFGAGIAGPCAAFWLSRLGHTCTIVERFPTVRAHGQQIDIREHGLETIKCMGLLDEVRSIVVDEPGMKFVDSNGNCKALFAKNEGKGRQSFTAEYEIMRGELCRLLIEKTQNSVTYKYGLTVTEYEDGEESVNVKFSDGTQETYDLLIAADGQGSKIRGMMLGDESELSTRQLGVFCSYYSVQRKPEDDDYGVVYHAPGQRVLNMRMHSKDVGQGYLLTMAHQDDMRSAMKQGVQEQKAIFGRVFRDAGWQAERLIKEMHRSEDYYAADIVMIDANKWSNGHVVLLGDSGYCPSPLRGMGTSLAIVGAYVLAGEISRHADLPTALKAYEEQLRPFVSEVHKLPPGVPSLAYPKSEWAIKLLHSMLGAITGLRIDRFLQAILPESQ